MLFLRLLTTSAALRVKRHLKALPINSPPFNFSPLFSFFFLASFFHTGGKTVPRLISRKAQRASRRWWVTQKDSFLLPVPGMGDMLFCCWMLRNSSHSASKAFPERIQCSIFSFELFQGTSSRSRSLELSKLTQPQSKTNTKKTVYPLDTNLGGHICHTRMKKKKSSSSKLWIDHFSSMLLAVLITVSFSSIKWIVSLGGSKHTKIKFLQACVSWWKCVSFCGTQHNPLKTHSVAHLQS